MGISTDEAEVANIDNDNQDLFDQILEGYQSATIAPLGGGNVAKDNDNYMVNDDKGNNDGYGNENDGDTTVTDTGNINNKRYDY